MPRGHTGPVCGFRSGDRVKGAGVASGLGLGGSRGEPGQQVSMPGTETEIAEP